MTDQELLARYYSDHNTEWLGHLLQRYTLLLLGVCMKYIRNEEEARDCVQQIFVKVITELSKYRVEYFKSWIYTIARNHCLMKLRDQHGRQTQLSDSLLSAWDEEPGKNRHWEKEQLLQWMSQALEELGNEQKLCVTLFYLEKRTYQEIASATGYTLMQVKSYIQNGKRNLKLSIEKKAREGIQK
ncbi:DNA-directed RNA polymerase sigma-70 factor [Puia dinghuensis]|uniref:DNA-directed RNA polymerase sigma-70 factor n=2 Tax=Puia dinghuensis TaxID=1792502 RepID=A0A8J2UC60_9BACT|nr:DNA-directed RNA polymerase sigma-70 factor [Puia dinghuensis]